MDIHFGLELPPYGASLLERIFRLSEAVFGEADLDHVSWRLSRMPDASVFTAELGERLIGFKAGYAMSERKYYSWLGGVHPDCRGQGVASRLMTRQHAWLADRGYSMVETATDRENRIMVGANLKHGFLIAGTRRNPDNTQILFLKQLDGTELS